MLFLKLSVQKVTHFFQHFIRNPSSHVESKTKINFKITILNSPISYFNVLQIYIPQTNSTCNIYSRTLKHTHKKKQHVFCKLLRFPPFCCVSVFFCYPTTTPGLSQKLTQQDATSNIPPASLSFCICCMGSIGPPEMEKIQTHRLTVDFDPQRLR